MSRTRNIKPGFFKNEVLAECPPLARILFAGLWTIADRAGRLEDRPKRIKAEVLPYDDCDVDVLLRHLAAGGFIQRYEAEGERYIQVAAWDKHQQPHIKEAASTIPEPCLTGASTEQESPHPSSLNLILDSGGAENAPQNGATPRPRSPSVKTKETPIPDDFTLSPSMTQYAKEWAAKYGATLDIPLMFEAFRTYFAAHQAKKHSDWEKAWQGWVVRELKEYGGGGKTNGVQTTEQRRLTPEQASARQEQGLQQRLDALARRKLSAGRPEPA